MKVLILGDLHGFVPQKPNFSYDCIICTGDLCDDRFIRPFLTEGFRLGVYWDELVNATEKKDLLRQTVESGKRVARQLKSFKKPIYIVPGNWDLTLGKTFEKTYFVGKNFTNCEFDIVELNDFCIVGYDGTGSPELPWRKKIWNSLTHKEQQKFIRSYTKKYAKFEKVYQKALKTEKPVILLSHNQPNKTKLDKVVNKPANIINKHLGSLIIRRIIDQFQPKLCIAGHIHETKGQTRLRKTTCLNAGHRSSAFLLDTTDWSLTSKRLRMQR